jgi:PIN domain nuclease of toxin-antitoxin system
MILDAYGVIAYLAGEQAADEVEDLLRNRDDPPAISAVNAGEVVDRLARVAQLDPSRVLDEMRRLRDGGLEILTVDAFDGLCAGALRNRFYDRREAQLSLADCTALAAAVRHGQSLATADPALAVAARTMSIVVVALPDSAGRRPV